MNTISKANASDKSDKPDKSDLSGATNDFQRAIQPSGGYRRLRSFQTAELVYDGTAIFCERFIDKRSRTNDQMIQAARSGRQNIAEGSVASATSKKSELKLTNVAKASLEELLLDYEDFLRQHRLRRWDKDSSEAMTVRSAYQSLKMDSYDPFGISQATPEVAANTLICLINQATFLLRRQLEQQEREFIEEGGFTERLYQTRSKSRANSESTDPVPACPRCQKPMVLRKARRGTQAGQSFWGCKAYPDCTGTRPFVPLDNASSSGE
jgi:four helix bundle suffix protein